MESIRELYRAGHGPSSSHTMAPRRAAEQFKQRYPGAEGYEVTLYGSLAATGKGHFTDRALVDALAPAPVKIDWLPDEQLPYHPNGMAFRAVVAGATSEPWLVYSVGGGALSEGLPGENAPARDIYDDVHTFSSILAGCERTGYALWEYAAEREGQDIWPFLREIWALMAASLDRGLSAEGVLPGGLGLARKAWVFQRKATVPGMSYPRSTLLFAYALAPAEENAAGGVVVTAPTCGSCGVVPGVLRYVQEMVNCSDGAILRALATAGLIGNLVKHNASISGAEVGCQGEIGTACAMAAAAATQLMGGTVRQIEYAAEMGLEHHLGLTCDPVKGMVQIPCIERNAFAAARAYTCATYALVTDGSHRISFDEVVSVMWQTGKDLPLLYRETSGGGLAEAYRRRKAAC